MSKKTRISLIVLLTVVLLLSLPASAMIGGELDKTHTNVGAIMMVWPQFEDIIGRLCTATLIHQQALLTAAHCYTYFENQGINYGQIWITFDQDPFATDAEYLGVKAFIPHPDFVVGGHYSSDIALVILEEPVEGIELQSLPRIGYMDDILESLNRKDRRDLELIIVGYGTSKYLDPPDAQQDAIRRAGTVAFENLLESEIRTSNSNPDNATGCMGDSGGPQFYLDQDEGKEVLVGVFSRTGVQRRCDDPMFHYRVDTRNAQKFINDTIKDNCPPK